jgi:hypothetical protein
VKPTLRQLLGYLAGARGHFVTAGSSEPIADLMEDWFRDGAADGFNLVLLAMLAMLAMLEALVANMEQLLRRRGLFRTGYTGDSLRALYGLPRPDVRLQAEVSERLRDGAST